MKILRALIRLSLPRANRNAHRWRRVIFLFLFGTSLITVYPPDSAGTSVSGNVQQIAPPASVVLGALESNSFVRFFSEKTAAFLSQNVSVDITQPNFVGNTSDLTPGVISAHQLVDSYLLHADAVGNGQPIVTYQGSVTFDRPILGILVQSAGLSATDSILGSPSTVYTPATVNRGFEWPSTSAVGDSLQMSADFLTITFVLKTESQYDQIRVITAGVPEPATVALAAGCLGVGFLSRLRRGQRLT